MNTLIVILSLASSLLASPTHCNTNPLPGSLSMSVNVTSLNNLLQIALPLARYYAVDSQQFFDQVIPVNYS